MPDHDGISDDPAITTAVARAAAGGEFRRKYITRLWGSPLVLGPLLLGATSLLGNWALNLQSGGLVFGGLAAVLAAGGIFLTRALLGGAAIGRDVARELAEDAQRAQEMRLFAIQRGLLADNDPGNDSYLKDLKEMVAVFRKPETWPESMDPATRATIGANVERLFGHCLRQMEKAQQLWQTAHQLQTPGAREPMLQRRKQLLKEVGDSLQHLGRALAGLNTPDSEGGKPGESEIARMQADLEQSLQAARAAEERMNALEREIGVRE